jgi:hypothetical protein
MKLDCAIFKAALAAFVLLVTAAGCGEREPVTVVFTGDTHGRLVPAG